MFSLQSVTPLLQSLCARGAAARIDDVECEVTSVSINGAESGVRAIKLQEYTLKEAERNYMRLPVLEWHGDEHLVGSWQEHFARVAALMTLD